MSWFRFKACRKCQGDLVLDQGDWLCLQCGRYYYTRLHEPRPNRQPEGYSSPRQPPSHHQDLMTDQADKTGPAFQKEKTVLPVYRVAGPMAALAAELTPAVMADGSSFSRRAKSRSPVQYLGAAY